MSSFSDISRNELTGIKLKRKQNDSYISRNDLTGIELFLMKLKCSKRRHKLGIHCCQQRFEHNPAKKLVYTDKQFFKS
jgi:hypothetical protein